MGLSSINKFFHNLTIMRMNSSKLMAVVAILAALTSIEVEACRGEPCNIGNPQMCRLVRATEANTSRRRLTNFPKKDNWKGASVCAPRFGKRNGTYSKASKFKVYEPALSPVVVPGGASGGAAAAAKKPKSKKVKFSTPEGNTNK